MLALIKANALYIFSIFGAYCAFMSLRGKNEWGIMLLIVLLPLRNVVDRLQSLPMGKDFVDLLILALILGWFIGSLVNKTKFAESSPINGVSIIMILYLLFSYYQGTSYIENKVFYFVDDTRLQMWKNFCILPVIYLIVFNSIHDKKWIWRGILLMCLTIFLMDYYVLQQIRWFSSLISRKKITGTFQFLGPNEVAAFYNQYTIILMSIYFFMKKSWKKMMLLGLIILNIVCILFLYSRAAYLGFVVGLIILFLIKNKKLLIPLVILGVLWQVALPEKVIQRIEVTHNEYGELDESSARRIQIWEASLEIFNSSPITGIGFGVFQYLNYDLGDTHNIYLKILAEQGMIGLAIFLLLIFSFFVQGVRLYLRAEDDLSKGLALGFSIAIPVLMINNFFGDRWTYMEVSAYLWIMAAFISRLIVMSKEQPENRMRIEPSKNPINEKKEESVKNSDDMYKFQ